MKINAGCGARILAGYCNVDVVAAPGHQPDIIADLRKIPLDDECADEILAVHVFEHFYKWDAADVLKEWRRLLKREGMLILELPDLIKCCQNIIAIHDGRTKLVAGKDPDQIGMWGLYGDPRTQNKWMAHHWSWSVDSLTAFLKENGFNPSGERETQFHPVGRRYRDMRIEARKQ